MVVDIIILIYSSLFGECPPTYLLGKDKDKSQNTEIWQDLSNTPITTCRIGVLKSSATM
jgi:hypothetical protein